MDKTADPCTDFYQYSCGGWMKNNPIPADQAAWSVYGKLAEENERFLWGILEEAAKPSATATPSSRRSATTSRACMDEAAVEKARRQRRCNADLDADRRAEVAKRSAARFCAKQHLASDGSGMLFGFGSNQDFADSTQVIAFADAGRPGPARPRLLHEDRREVGRDAREVRRARRSRCSSCWATRPTAAAAKRRP